MQNVYIPPPYQAEPKIVLVECGPLFECAGREAGVGTMRAVRTFLWMSDSSFILLDLLHRVQSMTNDGFFDRCMIVFDRLITLMYATIVQYHLRSCICLTTSEVIRDEFCVNRLNHSKCYQNYDAAESTCSYTY